jgi:hypothetical protein
VIGKPLSLHDGAVFWIAGSLVDKFSDFENYFLSMIDYNREELKALKS